MISKTDIQTVLEALTLAVSTHGTTLMSDPPQDAWKYHKTSEKCNKAIAILQAAIAEPEQEVIYRHKDGDAWFKQYASAPIPTWAVDVRPAEPSEPVCWQYRTRASWVPDWGLWTECTKEQYAGYLRSPKAHDWLYESRELFTHPPSKPEPLPELTDDEISHIAHEANMKWQRGQWDLYFARAILAAAREKK